MYSDFPSNEIEEKIRVVLEEFVQEERKLTPGILADKLNRHKIPPPEGKGKQWRKVNTQELMPGMMDGPYMADYLGALDYSATILGFAFETNDQLPLPIKRMGSMPIILLMAQGIELSLKSLKHFFDCLPIRQDIDGHSLEVLWKDLEGIKEICDLQGSIRSRYEDLCRVHLKDKPVPDIADVVNAYNHASVVSRYFLDGTYNTELDKMARVNVLSLCIVFRAIREIYEAQVLKRNDEEV